MNSEALQLLGFHEVVDLIARYAQTASGRELLRELQPLGEVSQIQRRRARLQEAVAILQEEGRVGLGRLDEPQILLRTLGSGSEPLEPSEFRVLADLLQMGIDLSRRFNQTEWPLIAGDWGGLEALPGLYASIDRVVDDEGEIRENADPQLAAMRQRAAHARRQVQQCLDLLLKENARYLAPDPYITQRNGRDVLPLKAEYRSRLPGLVHGSSSSGATLYVEPFEAVEFNNESILCQQQEREIIHRLLKRLSDHLREQMTLLTDLCRRIAQFDSRQAISSFAKEFSCTFPEIEESRTLAVQQARHPLLMHSLGKERTVPISLHLEQGQRVVVISGPNAGGKTLALKTLGLLVLMAHTGLPVPAWECRVGRLNQVLVDIGDHQSIERNLSTFSAHVVRVREMASELQPPALILLDELGTATDPAYGAAIGIAVIDYFRQFEVITVATTHHHAIKQFAATTEGVVNASVALDAETLQPTYALNFGAAGQSSALQIAGQLGLPTEILEGARRRLDGKQLEVEHYLEKLREEEATLKAGRLEIEGELRSLQVRELAQKEKFQRAEQELAKQAEKALAECQKEFRIEVNRFVKRVGDRFDAVRLKEEASRKEAHLKERFRRKMAQLKDPAEDVAGSVRPETVRPGEAVFDTFFQQQGAVVEVDGKTVILNIDGKRVTSSLDRILRREAREVVRRPSRHVTISVVEDASPELNVIGKRVDEAVALADKFLDRAFLSELRQVRIIHGFGKGKLRDALDRFLQGHPQVKEHRLEGGATVVDLQH